MNPSDPMQSVGEGLYCVVGRVGSLPLGRRMTVAALPAGVVIHSAVRMAEPDMQALEALGPVRWIVVPNRFHGIDAPWYAARYPAACVLMSARALRWQGRRVRVDGTLEDDWPAELATGLPRVVLGGASTGEAAFLHPPSRTLILTDLVFNLGDEFRGFLRVFLRVNGSLNRFGPSRLFRWVFLRDPAALAASLREVLAWDFDRIVMGHGEIVATDGKARLAAAFDFLDGLGEAPEPGPQADRSRNRSM